MLTEAHPYARLKVDGTSQARGRLVRGNAAVSSGVVADPVSKGSVEWRWLRAYDDSEVLTPVARGTTALNSTCTPVSSSDIAHKRAASA